VVISRSRTFSQTNGEGEAGGLKGEKGEGGGGGSEEGEGAKGVGSEAAANLLGVKDFDLKATSRI
jgi:hypothetical protein